MFFEPRKVRSSDTETKIYKSFRVSKRLLLALLIGIIGILVLFVYIRSNNSVERIPVYNETINWQTVTLDELHVKIQFPPSVKKQAEVRVSPGKKGKILCLDDLNPGNSTSDPLMCTGDLSLGTTSSDFASDTLFGFILHQGYTNENGIYYSFSTNQMKNEIPTPLTQKVVNSHGVEIIKVRGESHESGFPIPGTPGKGNIGALINLKNSEYKGLTLQMKLGGSVTEETFDQVLSTIRFTE